MAAGFQPLQSFPSPRILEISLFQTWRDQEGGTTVLSATDNERQWLVPPGAFPWVPGRILGRSESPEWWGMPCWPLWDGGWESVLRWFQESVISCFSDFPAISAWNKFLILSAHFWAWSNAKFYFSKQVSRLSCWSNCNGRRSFILIKEWNEFIYPQTV